MAGFSSSTYAILYPKIKKLQQYAVTGLKYISSISSLTQSPISTNKGDLYISNVEGTLSNFGGLTVKQGDGLIYNGSGWDKISYSELIKLQESFIIKDKYSDLTTTSTRDLVAYVINDENISGVDYKKGFYLFDKVSKTWSSISSSGDIASNTTLGNVIIKKDGGIEVDNNGNIWIEGYSKTESVDPITGNKTTIIDFNGIKTTTIETPTGDISKETVICGVPISTNTKTDPTTGDITTTTTIGGITTTTVTSTDSSTGDITTSTVKKDSITGETTEVTEKVDNTGNLISSSIVNKDKDGNEMNSITTTVTNKTDPVTGDSITETVVENANSSGISKIDTTTENNTTGTTTNKTEYEAVDDLFATRDDVDGVYDDIFNDLDW